LPARRARIKRAEAGHRNGKSTLGLRFQNWVGGADLTKIYPAKVREQITNPVSSDHAC
jgi:hypothetical protein